MFACREPHAEDVVKLLLDAGAYVDARMKNMTTPLMMAMRYSSRECVKLLLEGGANPNAVDSSSKTPLAHALEATNDNENRLEKIKMLVFAGADPKRMNSDRETLLDRLIPDFLQGQFNEGEVENVGEFDMPLIQFLRDLGVKTTQENIDTYLRETFTAADATRSDAEVEIDVQNFCKFMSELSVEEEEEKNVYPANYKDIVDGYDSKCVDLVAIPDDPEVQKAKEEEYLRNYRL